VIMLVGRDAAGRDLRGDVTVTAVADEEFASIGVQGVVRHRRADAAIVTEPTGLDLCVAHKGFVWLEVETRGVASHGTLPEEGIDAIAKMGPVLTGLADLDRELRSRPGHPLVGPASIHASLIRGGQELSTYPARCLLSIERRTILGETIAEVEGQIAAILAGASEADPSFQAEQRTLLVRDPFRRGSGATDRRPRTTSPRAGNRPGPGDHGSRRVDGFGVPCRRGDPDGDLWTGRRGRSRRCRVGRSGERDAHHGYAARDHCGVLCMKIEVRLEGIA
jgi:acetylornithine deacetylase/succinyl-diaminopimelate desuccinylase-like protein